MALFYSRTRGPARASVVYFGPVASNLYCYNRNCMPNPREYRTENTVNYKTRSNLIKNNLEQTALWLPRSF